MNQSEIELKKQNIPPSEVVVSKTQKGYSWDIKLKFDEHDSGDEEVVRCKLLYWDNFLRKNFGGGPNE